jgi:hypothetical protein
MILLISYDLNGHERPAAYARVKAYIEANANAAIRPLYSQWFIETTATPEQWVDAFRNNGIVDGNDSLFICEVHHPFQGLLTKPHWDWLYARV